MIRSKGLAGSVSGKGEFELVEFLYMLNAQENVVMEYTLSKASSLRRQLIVILINVVQIHLFNPQCYSCEW